MRYSIDTHGLSERRACKLVGLPRSSPLYANERWSMDSMADQLENGKRFRMLNIVDDRTREC